MKQIKILHVDDRPDFLALTKAHLEDKDGAFSVDTATTAKEGLKLLKDNTYDVVLSDYQMPGMDGLKFLQHLREDGSRIPFIMLTGRGREEVAIAALNNGADHYIQKGEDIESLYETVAHVIRETVEQRRAADRLAVIEKERQMILDSVPAMIYYVDKDGNYVYVNKNLADACGLEIDDFIGKSPRDIFPQCGSDFAKSDAEVVKSGKPKKEVDGIFQTPEGKKWIKTYKTPLKDAKGTVTGIVGLGVDITERKRAETAQLELEERYRRLVELSFEGIAIHNGEKILLINPAGAELLGGTNPDQFIGKSVMDVVYPDYQEIVQERVRQQMEDKQAVPLIEEKFIKLDGTVIDVEVMAIPITHQNKPAMHVVFRDITERKKTEETLQESEKRFRDLTELLPQTVYELDTAGNLVYTNQTGLKLFGYSKKDLKSGLTAFQMFISEDYDRVVKNVQKVLSGQKLVVAKFTALRKDGTTFPVIIHGTPRMHDGEIVGVRGIVEDITERKRAENERERFLRELEAKNDEMERFTYTVSHDLRSPLFAIQGFTKLALEALEQGNLGNLESDLKRVESAAEKMDNLLNDTLQLSRIGRVANPPEDVSFGTIVEGALELVATQIKSSGVEITTAEDFPTVHVDRERIEEILVNLIGNSIKYMGEQPRPKIEIGYRVEDEDTVFFVRDNGIGIDPRHHKQVFELFYKVDKNSKGTGAGLAIVKRIIEVHGGRIWIDSEKGKGCTVCFTLPMQ